MIRIQNLKKTYGEITVLDIPELVIQEGESFGLVGNNGAGKTTLFRLLLDLIEPDSGEVQSGGLPVKKRDEWKQFTGSFLDESFLIDFLTANEYLQFVGKLYGKNRTDVERFVERMGAFFGGEISLSDKKLIREYSKGNQKKIGIVAALLIEPSVLILDEPFTALDPTTQIRLKRLLADEQARTGMTMLISSHDLNHIVEVCPRIVILEKGRVVKDLSHGNNLSELEAYFTEQLLYKP